MFRRLDLNIAIWFIGGVAQLALCVVMLRKGWYRTQKTFFAYIVFETIKCFGLYGARAWSYRAYFWGYWLSQFFALILATAVIQDLIEQAAESVSNTRRLLLNLFFLVSVAACIVAALSALVNKGAVASSVVSAVLVGERSFRVLQTILLIFVLTAIVALRLPLRSLGVAIVSGMAVIVTVNLIAVNVMWANGSPAKATYELIKQLSEAAVDVAWVISCLVVSPENAASSLDSTTLERLRGALRGATP